MKMLNFKKDGKIIMTETDNGELVIHETPAKKEEVKEESPAVSTEEE